MKIKNLIILVLLICLALTGTIFSIDKLEFLKGEYSGSSTGTSYIQPDEIVYLRCDGVVEYCYEWYDFRVYGSNSQWDITYAGNTAHHSLPYITPKIQAESYMTFIQNTIP